MPLVTGMEIAIAARRYKGTKYKWAGYLPQTGWDCSGFVNFVLGNHFGMTLPGGYHWTGRAHGPIALQYKLWRQATTVASPSAGMLCCWMSHIGIALSENEMISALSPKLGTAVTPISGYGPAGERVSFRKINTVAASMPVAPLTGPPLSAMPGCAPAMLFMPVMMLRGRHANRAAEPGD